MEPVELRCTDNPRRLFGKLLMTGAPLIRDGNLMEFACRDCARDLAAAQVLHRFDVTGELVETVVIDD